MSPLPSTALKVHETTSVAPPPGTVPESSLPLTYFDLLWVHCSPVERVFFYHLPRPTAYFLDVAIPALKSSLSHTLRYFYPMAGTLRRSPHRPDGLEINYSDGDSVPFTVAELDGEDFDDLSSSHAREFTRILRLVPELPNSDADGGKRVFSVQVTVFPNQGVAVGVSVLHTACDDSSTLRFMTSWGAACAGAAAAPDPPPVLDRSLVVDPNDLYSMFYKGFVTGIKPGVGRTLAPDAMIRSFTLGACHIRRLKELALAGGSEPFHCSTIVVAFAYVWVCLLKAEERASDRYALVTFSGECRAMLRPRLPAAYFGNCLSICLAEMRTGELTGEGGFAAAARATGKAVEAFKAGPFEWLVDCRDKYKSLTVEEPLSMTGSPKFRVYDVDFGWGRPKKVEIPFIAKVMTMSVAESREEHGGVEIGLVLPKNQMDKFVAEFNTGLKL